MSNPRIYNFTNANSGINPNNFQPLVLPFSCTGYLLKNAGPDTLYLREDPNDANTQDTMPSGFYEDLTMSIGNVIGHGESAYRYAAGAVLYYVKCTGPLVFKGWA